MNSSNYIFKTFFRILARSGITIRITLLVYSGFIMTGLLISPPIVTGENHIDFELPESKKECSLCHLSDRLEEGTRLIKPVSKLCADCHPDRTTSSEHSVDVIPSMPVEGLPLSLEGKITCITCHDPHKNLYGTMLRMKTEILCQICHKK